MADSIRFGVCSSHLPPASLQGLLPPATCCLLSAVCCLPSPLDDVVPGLVWAAVRLRDPQTRPARPGACNSGGPAPCIGKRQLLQSGYLCRGAKRSLPPRRGARSAP